MAVESSMIRKVDIFACLLAPLQKLNFPLPLSVVPEYGAETANQAPTRRVDCELVSSQTTKFPTPPACYRSLSGPSGPKCPRSVPRGVFGALRAPGSGVSKKCPESVPDTLGTLSGHLLDTPEPGARRDPETLRGTLPGHFGPEGREKLL